jgi:hypothetical protein
MKAIAKNGEAFDQDKMKFVTRIFQLMIGIGAQPRRAVFKDFPYKESFPKTYLPEFITELRM